jgi:hypothetical protein
VSSVFQDFRYVRSFVEEHAMGLALVFEARIGSRTIEGVDFLRLNSLGPGGRLPGHGPPALRARGADGGDGAGHRAGPAEQATAG